MIRRLLIQRPPDTFGRLVQSCLWALLLIAVVVSVASQVGCNGKAQAKYERAVRYERFADGHEAFTFDTAANNKAEAPANAQLPTTANAGPNGSESTVSGTWKLNPSDIVAGQAWVVYIIAGILTAAAGVALWRGMKTLAIGLGVGAGVAWLMPTLGPALAGPLAIVIVVAVIGAIALAVWRYFGAKAATEREKTATTAQAVEDARNGDLKSAWAKAETLPRFRSMLVGGKAGGRV